MQVSHSGHENCDQSERSLVSGKWSYHHQLPKSGARERVDGTARGESSVCVSHNDGFGMFSQWNVFAVGRGCWKDRADSAGMNQDAAARSEEPCLGERR